MDDFKSNSFKSREEESEKRVEAPIAKGKARKKSGIRRFFGSLIASDTEDVKDYVLKDIVGPGIKNLIVDTVIDSVKMILGVDDRGGRRSDRSSRVSYRDYYGEDRGRRRDRDRDEDFRGYDLDDAIVDSRGEAERVIDKLKEIIERYGYATVADLCELVGLPSRYTDNKYGWTRIASAKAVRVRDGYLIQLPRPKPLD